MKAFFGLPLILLAFVITISIIVSQCTSPSRAEAQSCLRCDCPMQSYTETVFIGGRTILCTVFVDSCGNVTRVCS